jgi:hypothetical protein
MSFDGRRSPNFAKAPKAMDIPKINTKIGFYNIFCFTYRIGYYIYFLLFVLHIPI